MTLTDLEQTILGQVWTSDTLWQTIGYLCDECNGRFAGSDDEQKAGDFLLAQFGKIGLENVHAEPFTMRGWQRGDGQLVMPDGDQQRQLPCMVLAGSPAGQVEGALIDIGAGTPEVLARLGKSVKGKIVLAGSQRPHRLEKYASACQAGASGFLFASSRPGMFIPAGSLNLGDKPASVPGVGISMETAAFLRRRLGTGPVRVKLRTGGQTRTITARNIVADLPGATPDAGWIVVCGHYDGHDIAQGAQDNATGAAMTLELAHLLAPLQAHLRAGVRFVLFSGEELGMFGSENYVHVHADELDQIRAVFNADIVGLAAPLMLMVQNSPALARYFNALPLHKLDARVVDDRLVPYSDHFPFTLAGVASLMAVTSPPGAGRGWAHTIADTLDKIERRPLYEAVATAARLVLRMAVAPDGLPAQRQSPRQVKQAIIDAGLEQPLRLQGRWPFQD